MSKYNILANLFLVIIATVIILTVIHEFTCEAIVRWARCSVFDIHIIVRRSITSACSGSIAIIN